MGINIMVTTGGTGLVSLRNSACRLVAKASLRADLVTSLVLHAQRDDILRLDEVVHVICATPGRLLDLSQKKVGRVQPGRGELAFTMLIVYDAPLNLSQIAKLDQCKTFVMDEVSREEASWNRQMGWLR